jgi:hypothetical protein
MKIALYFDEDSQDSSLIRALRSGGVDVISASESGMNGRRGTHYLLGKDLAQGIYLEAVRNWFERPIHIRSVSTLEAAELSNLERTDYEVISFTTLNAYEVPLPRIFRGYSYAAITVQPVVTLYNIGVDIQCRRLHKCRKRRCPCSTRVRRAHPLDHGVLSESRC